MAATARLKIKIMTLRRIYKKHNVSPWWSFLSDYGYLTFFSGLRAMIIKLFWTSTSLSVFPFSWRTSAAFSWKSFCELLLIFHQTSARPVPVLLKYKKVPVLLKSTSTSHFHRLPVWSQCVTSSTLRHICRQSGRGTNQYLSLMRAFVELVS